MPLVRDGTGEVKISGSRLPYRHRCAFPEVKVFAPHADIELRRSLAPEDRSIGK